MAAAASSMMFAAPVSAGVVYSNNFDAENGGVSALNYTGFNGLTITDGTVDLVKSGDFGIKCAGGSGACVDLDGSTFDSGIISSTSYAFNAGDRVSLNFLYSGNQRQLPVDSFRTSFFFLNATNLTAWGGSAGSASGTGSPVTTNEIRFTRSFIEPDDGFIPLEFYFVAGSAGAVNFQIRGEGNDNIGVIIDNLSLSITAVPEPSTWAMLILGFGAIGAAARRRKAAGAAAFA